MSCIFPIFTQMCLSKEEVFNIVKEQNGYIIGDETLSKGVITKGEATIWIYYRGTDIELELNTLEKVKKLYDIEINTEVAVSIGHGENSEKLAADFCIQFLKVFPKSIVEYGGFLGMNELKKWHDAPIIEY